MQPTPEIPDAFTMNRREAIKRAAWVLGFAISPSLLRGAMEAPVPRPDSVSKPVHLNATQLAIVTAAAERIIPRTDTPGATDVGVPAFVDVMIGGYMTDAEKTSLQQGLARLNRLSLTTHQQGFAQLTPEQQDAILTKLAESSDALERGCFRRLRELTVLGYFTSQPVGTTVLHYDPVPGRYEGCLPLSEVGNKVWYTTG